MKAWTPSVLLSAVLGALFFPAAHAKDGADEASSGSADLAQELTNPVADLLTIPVQMTFDGDIGPAEDGWKVQTNIQTMYPLELNEDWKQNRSKRHGFARR